jgi:hypothetical protein
VYFSFHYKRDVWRAYIVRKSGYYKETEEAAGFWDHSLIEKAKTDKDSVIRKMINQGLYGTSVTAVLIGNETWKRKWVNYEIEQSFNRCNGILGIYIHNLKNNSKVRDKKGKNPFNYHYTPENICFSDFFNCYDWKYDKGSEFFRDWVEEAAKDAGR